MGFLSNLKKRLFSLDSKNLEGISQDKDLENKDISSLNEKLIKKEESERAKARIKQGKIDKYVAGLNKSNLAFTQRIKQLQSKSNIIDEEYFEELEEILIMSDISLSLVMEIIDEIKKEVRLENIKDTNLINEIIMEKIFTIYTNQSTISTRLNIQQDALSVFIIVGVNGVGKTTSIAKLAYDLVGKGKKVLIAAGDTFRAGAVAQLEVWSRRVNCDIVKPVKDGVDPSSVVFDAVQKAKNEGYDVLIVDTAGRLQNKVNLMKELEKISKIISREIPGAPHESLLVLDATTGQNGVSQAKNFKEVTPLTGIILTKMDGTSKGGIVLTIKDELNLSVKFVGLGEKIDDLEEFDLDAFIFGMMKGLVDDKE